ncbi:M50 family metallopeptidase [Haliangium ochraceum]|uniref:Membrane-associated zinc metalloprotease n=1 Tax=Haliangium ochraceum (strain DSM 14365 / JCM 11303 / SMP-2) TaxID=502025 RepID=D0LVJ4_HALO1|nr:M50 family metallopeptidase [Haliangium ochraceum]ACY17555.1 membrane-associated zinc metalloprotease [Haliangium ochraceum DSM 14365]
MSVLGAILALSLIIVVHEAGHYLVAKWCKMRVDRFSIGFGPAIASWNRGETKFQLAPIPFGGFVEIRGMNIAEDVPPDDPYAYPNRPTWQRFLTIFAGPGTNYLFATVLAFVLFAVAGVPSGTSHYVVNGVASEGFDAIGKLEPGDQIMAVQRASDSEPQPVYVLLDGKPAEKSLSQLVHESQGAPMQVDVLRDGQAMSFSITARPDQGQINKETGEPQYRLGISLETTRERVGVGLVAAVGYAVEFPIEHTKLALANLYQMIMGEVEAELTGPVGIADVIQQSIRVGWIDAMAMLILLNVLVGLFNLLPIPALDGGRLVFLIYEMATRRRPNPRFEATVHMVGIMVLLVVLVAVTVKDIARIIERL